MQITSKFQRAAMAGLALWFTLAAQAAPPGREHDPALLKQYESKWLGRERQARDTKARVALAKDLYEAAEATDDRAMKLLLLDMCWAWGNQDCPNGYHYAAKAVQTIRTLDPTRRVECLERMAYLFKTAWERDRRKFLGNGIELANAKMLIADQRLLDLCTRFSNDRITEAEFETGLTQCKRDYLQAQLVARRVLGVAKSYSRSHPNPKARQALADFARDNQPLADRIEGGREELAAFCIDYARHGESVLPEPIEKTEPIEVASAEPAPEPESEPEPAAAPEPEPAPQPEPVATTTTPRPAEPAASKPVNTTRRGGVFRQLRCEKCGDPFVPEFGSEDKVCYWCKNELGFFRIEE